MNENNLWSRRKFSKAILSLQALVAAGTLKLPISCMPPRNTPDDEWLDSDSQRLLQKAMDEIIPRSQKMPAASEVGGIDYIKSVLKKHPDLINGFKEVLDELHNLSMASTNDLFQNLDKSSRIAVLRQFEKEQFDVFTVLKLFVYESYYINQEVWKQIGYEPYPTLSAGPQMEPFDESLLKRVKLMSSLYLNV